jgi:hypothetical protein
MAAEKKKTKRKGLTKTQILNKYNALARELGGRSPSIAELKSAGLTRNAVRYHFATREDLDKAARAKAPKSYRDVPIGDVEFVAPKSKTYLVTSPVLGAPAHKGFCKALRTMADRKGAEILALPVADPASRATPNGEGRVDLTLLDLGFRVVHGDFDINENLSVLGVEVSAKQLQPLTGLDRFGQRGKSVIVPAPKMFLRYVPTLSKTPHAVMTPGACTLPNYGTDKHRSKRTAYLARQDHKLAALVVEVESNKRFHFRQLEWSEDAKNIVDLGVTHDGKEFKPQAVQPGDWHSGQTAAVNRDWVLSNPYGADEIFLHDSFDGESINHHHKYLDRQCRRLSLNEELTKWNQDIEKIASVYKRVYVVQSNHDDRLVNWLRNGEWTKDPVNFHTAIYFIEAANPLESWLGEGHDVKFLSRDDSVKIGGVEMSQHGDIGPNGSRRPTLRSLEKSLGPCCVGHSHTPGIWREAWQAGTCTHLKLDYTAGPSSWLWSHILIYPDGRRQMINLLPDA